MEEDKELFYGESSDRDYSEEDDEAPEHTEGKHYVPNDFVRYRQIRDKWKGYLDQSRPPVTLEEAQQEVRRFIEHTDYYVKKLIEYGLTYDWCRRHRQPHLVDLAADLMKQRCAAFPEVVKWAEEKLRAMAGLKVPELIESRKEKKKYRKEEVKEVVLTAEVTVSDRRLGWWARQELYPEKGDSDAIKTVTGRLDFRVSIFLDNVAKNFLRHLAANPGQKLPLLRPHEFYESAEEEMEVSKGLKELKKTDVFPPEIKLSEVEVRESDFKAIEAFRGYSSKQIEAIVEKASKIIVLYWTKDNYTEIDGDERKEWLEWKDLLFHLVIR